MAYRMRTPIFCRWILVRGHGLGWRRNGFLRPLSALGVLAGRLRRLETCVRGILAAASRRSTSREFECATASRRRVLLFSGIAILFLLATPRRNRSRIRGGREVGWAGRSAAQIVPGVCNRPFRAWRRVASRLPTDGRCRDAYPKYTRRLGIEGDAARVAYT